MKEFFKSFFGFLKRIVLLVLWFLFVALLFFFFLNYKGVHNWYTKIFENLLWNDLFSEDNEWDISHEINLSDNTIKSEQRDFDVNANSLYWKVSLTWFVSDNIERIAWTLFSTKNENIIYSQLSSLDDHVIFVLENKPWYYSVAVKIFYNSWEVVDVYKLLSGPTYLVQPLISDIPIVVLKSDKMIADVWDPVTFEVISEVLSDRDDFEKEKMVWIDVDWDWVWDYTWNNNKFVYKFSKSSPNAHPYLPRAAVIYRDYRWIWEGNEIIIKDNSSSVDDVNEDLKYSDDYIILSSNDVYLDAKNQILWILPSKLKVPVERWFRKLESFEGDNKEDGIWEMKKWLETIDRTISNKVVKSNNRWGEDEISFEDYNSIVKPNICVIVDELDIPTQICSDN